MCAFRTSTLLRRGRDDHQPRERQRAQEQAVRTRRHVERDDAGARSPDERVGAGFSKRRRQRPPLLRQRDAIGVTQRAMPCGRQNDVRPVP